MTSEPTPTSPPAGRKRGLVLNVVLLSAVCGAVVGVWMTRSGKSLPSQPLLLSSPMAMCFYCWILLSAYWSSQAKKVSVAKSAEPSWSRGVHLTLITAAQLIVLWPFPGWPSASPSLFAFPKLFRVSPGLEWLGVAMAAGGLVFAIWSRRMLGRNWSGEVTAKVDHELVRSGPYRRIRHPIYTGAILMYVGPALVSGRWQGPIALALVAVAYARKIRQEETVLSGEFGAAYDEYRRESWALIPWIL